MDKRTRRRLTPSNATSAGAAAGALGTVLVAGLSAAGVPITPELAAAIPTALGTLLAYVTRGGRKDEPQ